MALQANKLFSEEDICFVVILSSTKLVERFQFFKSYSPNCCPTLIYKLTLYAHLLMTDFIPVNPSSGSQFLLTSFYSEFF